MKDAKEFAIAKSFSHLNQNEKNFVDESISQLKQLANNYGIKIKMDDRIERVVESISQCVIQSKN
jgi:transcriptional regulator with XRE-family HTH domain